MKHMKILLKHKFNILAVLMVVVLFITNGALTTLATETETTTAAETTTAVETTTVAETESTGEAQTEEESSTSDETTAQETTTEETETKSEAVTALQEKIDALPDANDEGFVIDESNIQELSDLLSEVNEELAKMKDKDANQLDLTKFDELTAAVMKYMEEHGEGGLVLMSAVTPTPESEWIDAARTYANTSTFDKSQQRHFYEAVSFASDGSGSLTWQAAPSGTPVWDGTASTTCTSSTSGSTITYEPTTPAQLYRAFLDMMGDTGTTNEYIINIKNDMDLGGHVTSDTGYLWPSNIIVQHNLTLNGNNHTLYNLYMKQDNPTGTIYNITNGKCGFINSIASGVSFYANGINISGANVLGATNSNTGAYATGGLVGHVNANAKDVQFTNCEISHALIITRGDSAAGLVGRLVMDNNTSSRFIDNCHAIDVVAVGGQHVGTLTGAVTLKGTTDKNIKNYIDRCYSVEGIVVSFSPSGHSGGLFSCMGGNDYGVTNCFVDAQVYGIKDTGVFTGAVTSGVGRVAFMNCFSSGFVEGTEALGGFVGSSGYTRNQFYFFDCYSTALVGLSSEGKNLGGFGGNMDGVIGYSNCYAAGEVGNAQTVTEGAKKGTNQVNSNGGFLGTPRPSYCIAVNSFYDKQTTAMQEYDLGATHVLSLDKVITSDKSYLTIMNTAQGAQGLRGCLTTTTAKSGGGLTSDGTGSAATVAISTGGTSVDVGFNGFRNDSDCMKYTANASYKGWNDSTVAAQLGYKGNTCWDTSKDGSYPELLAFSENRAGFDHEDVDLVKAYSSSSTSTVMLDPWEKQLNTTTGVVDVTVKDGEPNPSGGTFTADDVNKWATTYDTVRDITARFKFSSDDSVEKWQKTKTQDGDGSQYATSTVKNEEVFKLLTIDGIYFGDYFAPGLEWTRVMTKSGTANGYRRLRLMPTCGIDAGESAEIIGESRYDHADDVALYFTTRQRLDIDSGDVTQGIFPDSEKTYVGTVQANAISQSQIDLSSKSADKLLTADAISTAYESDNSGNFGGNDQFIKVPVNNLSENEDDNARGGEIFTYAQPITSYDEDSGRLDFDTSKGAIDFTITSIQNQFNGYTAFSSNINGSYIMQYQWKLADGRCVTDGKVIQIKAVPFTVTIAAKNPDGTPNASDVSLDVTNLKTALDTSYSGIPDTATSSDSDFDDQVAHKDNVVTGWKVQNDFKWVQSITVRFHSVMQKPVYVYEKNGNQIAQGINGNILTYDSDGMPICDTVIENGQTYYVPKGETEVKRDDNGYPYYYQATYEEDVVKDGNVEHKQGDPIYEPYYYEVTVDNPEELYEQAHLPEADPNYKKDANIVTVPYVMFHYIMAVNGNWYVSQEKVERKYEIKKTADGTYYLAFNKTDEEAISSLDVKVILNDVSDNIDTIVTVDNSLVVMKEVTGNLGELSREFTFEITITPSDTPDAKGNKLAAGDKLKVYLYDYDGKNGTKTLDDLTVGTKYTVTLKHHQYLRIAGLMEGTKYTITETAVNGYTTTAFDLLNKDEEGKYTSLSLTSNKTEDVITGYSKAGKMPSSGAGVLFRNNKEMPPMTGTGFTTLPYAVMAGIILSLLILILFFRKMKRKQRGHLRC